MLCASLSGICNGHQARNPESGTGSGSWLDAGRLKVGAQADIVVLSPTGEVKKTIIGGSDI